MKWVMITSIAIGTILAIIMIILLILSYKVFRIQLYYKNNHRGLKNLHKNEEISRLKENEKNWWKSKNPKVVTIQNKGITLVGEFLDNHSDKTVILMHGFHSYRYARCHDAIFYNRLGYNVLICDERSHYQSQGKYITMGYWEQEDLKKWISFVISMIDNAKIVLDGVSMGASTVLMLANTDIPEIKCIVSDCAYTSAYDIFDYQLTHYYHQKTKLLLELLRFWGKLLAKFDFKKASPLEKVQKATKPIFFIHGENDEFVPCKMVDILYNATITNKKKVIAKNASHALARFGDCEPLYKELEVFLNESLK